MNTNTKRNVVIWVLVGLLILAPVLRYVLRETGMPFIFVGLPVGGIGVLLLLIRLGVINFGGTKTDQFGHHGHFGHQNGVYSPPQGFAPPAAPGTYPPPAAPGAYPPPAAPVASPQPVAAQPAAPVYQRLQELETLRATRAISDTEYNARRQGIISDL